MKIWTTARTVTAGAALSLVVLWGTFAAFDRDSVNTVVLPDFDSGQAAILSLSDGVLRLPPASDLDKNKAKQEVQQLGDIAYDYVDTPNLFVSSGRVLKIASDKLSLASLVDAARRMDEAETISGNELNVGSIWLVQTRQGGHALLRVVRINQRQLEIDWLYTDDKQARFGKGKLEELMSRSMDMVTGTVVLNAANSDRVGAFRFSDQREIALRWPRTATDDPLQLRNSLDGADIASFSSSSATTLILGAEKYAFLGRGSLADYASTAAEKTRSLSREPYIRSQFMQPGAVFLLETLNNRYVLVRVDKTEKQSLTISYVYQPDGTAVFDLGKQEPVVVERTDMRENNIGLLQAAQTGSATRAQQMIAAGADVNAKNRRGFTALQVAITREDQPTIDALLDAGADPELNSNYGWNALHMAAQYGNAKAVSGFLQRGMNANQLTPDGETALQIAVASPRETDEVQSILQSNSKTRASLFDAAMADDATAVQSMASGENINAVDSRGRTALILAAEYGATSALEALLDKGADPAIVAPFRQGDALSVAARAGRTQVIQVLAPVVSVEQKTEALYHAIVSQQTEAMLALLDAGADLSAHSHMNASLRDQAFSYGRAPIVSALRDKGEVLPLWAAARLGDIEAIDAALARTPVFDKSPVGGESALALAVVASSIDSVRRLIQYGGDLSAKEPDGNTVLHLAAKNKLTDMVGFLLDRGAKIDDVATSGRTALAIAAVNADLATMKLLLNKGASVAVIPPGVSSLAEISYSEEAQKLLVSYGAPLPTENQEHDHHE